MTLVLGLGNKARHGKDSFALAVDAHFATQHAAALRHGLKHTPVVIQHLAFADALYKEVNEFLAIPKSFDYSYQELFSMGVREIRGGEVCVDKIPDWVQPDPKPKVSARAPFGKHAKLLQWWGTEFRRAQDQDYWVKQWKAAINPKANIVMVTDMRFLNEAAAVKSVGGFTVQVNRKNGDGTPFVDPTRPADHVSETELDGYNYDYQLTVKTGDLALLDQWATALVYYLRALKGHK
jgi:hypothetical protein